MKRLVSCGGALLVLASALASCSHWSKSARGQRSYARYVQKASMSRLALQKKIRAQQQRIPSAPPVSAPVETTQSGPELVTSSDNSQ